MPGQYQSKDWYCSPAALQCALACLGVRVGQGRLAAAIGVTEDGADEDDIIGAISALKLRPDPFHTDSKQEARRYLLERAAIHPIILCVDDWGHWVTVAGQCNDRLFLFDPSKEVWNAIHRGGWPLKTSTILKRWAASKAKRGPAGAYYAIGIMKF